MSEILKQKFMLRIDNLEARLTTKHLISNATDEDYTVDIVEWSEDYEHNWSIAFFVPTKNGTWDLKFVGDRPLKPTVDWGTFRILIKSSLQYLNGLTASLKGYSNCD